MTEISLTEEIGNYRAEMALSKSRLEAAQNQIETLQKENDSIKADVSVSKAAIQVIYLNIPIFAYAEIGPQGSWIKKTILLGSKKHSILYKWYNTLPETPSRGGQIPEMIQVCDYDILIVLGELNTLI